MLGQQLHNLPSLTPRPRQFLGVICIVAERLFA
jgi:hypothetical protein